MTLRIIHALASYELGGGEMLALRLASYQRRAGHEVSVVAFDGAGPLRERFAAADVETHIVAKRPGFDLTLFPRLMAFFLRQRRGIWPLRGANLIVHTHNPQSLVYAAPAARGALARVVHTKHGEAAEGRRAFQLRRGAARFVDAFVSVSAQTDAFARENDEAPLGRLHVIENGVEVSAYALDAERRRALRAEVGAGEETFVIGTVGRLQPVKNQELLLRAAAPLLSKGDTQLAFIGDGPERAALEGLAEELGVKAKVHFAGYQKDVAAWLGALDCFALSSHTEGLPLVLMEAMAARLPTVCTAVGGIPVAVGEAGKLVAAGDEAALSAQLGAFRDDPEAARELGAAGHQRVVERYAFEVMAQRYAALYLS